MRLPLGGVVVCLPRLCVKIYYKRKIEGKKRRAKVTSKLFTTFTSKWQVKQVFLFTPDLVVPLLFTHKNNKRKSKQCYAFT